nr:hypothetical protein [Moritella viscosa]SHO01260.1 Probable cytosol aminopeptidase-Leucine aminopeptidase-Leucyl aminopeptidase [Moritella viscosa]
MTGTRRIYKTDLPQQQTTIYDLSRRDCFNLMLTGHQTNRVPASDPYITTDLDCDDISIVTGCHSNRSNEISIRHSIAAGINIHVNPLYKEYRTGYNQSLFNLIHKSGLPEQAARETVNFIIEHTEDRNGSTCLDFNNLANYLHMKEAIEQPTLFSLARDFLKLEPYGLTRTLSNKTTDTRNTIGATYMFNVLCQLIQFKTSNELSTPEHAYINICVLLSWYSINNDRYFKQVIDRINRNNL